jgi:diadenosine tetraphosphate (Ap4A) HIT family hydrolase
MEGMNMLNNNKCCFIFAIILGLAVWAPTGIIAQNPTAPITFEDDSWNCPCDHSRLEMLAYPPCSLCWEAEEQPPDVVYFFVRDIDPLKPNRWLILPRAHTRGMQHFSDLNAADSQVLWAAAIEKAKALWGNQWGLAVNGDGGNTQCHAHAHIGKLPDGVEDRSILFKKGRAPVPGKEQITLKGPEDIKAPANGESFWIHPFEGGLHLHIEDRLASAEFVLMR